MTQAEIIFNYLSDSHGFLLFEDSLVNLKSGLKIKLLKESINNNFGDIGDFFEVEKDGLTTIVHISHKLIASWFVDVTEYTHRLNQIGFQIEMQTHYKEINSILESHSYPPLFQVGYY